MRQSLLWFLRWYRRRAIKTKILIALIIVATFMGCFGVLTPAGGPRSGPTATPAARAEGALLYTGSG